MGKMTFFATGDSFITRRLPSTASESFRQLSGLIQSADVRFNNLETTTHVLEGYPSAFSGGTWAMSPPDVLQDIRDYGFNLLAWANNHTMDYSYGGLLATKRYLNQYGFVHAGAGEDLAEASAPRYLETPPGRVALISVTSTFHESWRAGSQRPDMHGRPGVNPLRYDTTFYVSRQELDQLKAIAENTMINAERNLSIKEGFETDNSDDSFVFGGHYFTEGSTTEKVTTPKEADMRRLERSIDEARRQADVVMVSIHSHEMEGEDKAVPPQFLKEASRKCIDGGADAVMGHGPHVLRGIEIYQNKPIFYSLGNFIFQNDTVEALPADFYDKYGLSSEANVADALDARSGNNTKGLGVNKHVWESVVAVWEMDNGQITDIKLYPIELGFDLPRYERGWPVLSKSESPLEQLQHLSKPFGTDITIQDGVGIVSLQA
ncbi:CapA family protein [Lentibacillus amyloliquefaciens]|uniref:Capsule biosynthesis protein n=1 Tax=Lentibacillus amyloliquefaciens TaxID=1472767 RepID=A0A0U4FGG0_9BACI|nr:CapA family protein [Lentibacillus amyloliquefaciens]ALX47742.1 capsule biosynthesis protein [Lentibacillus amyloliquefaciens]